MKNVSDYQVGKDTGENTTQQTNRNFNRGGKEYLCCW
mgnify:CR=1 FL=1